MKSTLNCAKRNQLRNKAENDVETNKKIAHKSKNNRVVKHSGEQLTTEDKLSTTE